MTKEDWYRKTLEQSVAGASVYDLIDFLIEELSQQERQSQERGNRAWHEVALYRSAAIAYEADRNFWRHQAYCKERECARADSRYCEEGRALHEQAAKAELQRMERVRLMNIEVGGLADQESESAENESDVIA